MRIPLCVVSVHTTKRTKIDRVLKVILVSLSKKKSCKSNSGQTNQKSQKLCCFVLDCRKKIVNPLPTKCKKIQMIKDLITSHYLYLLNQIITQDQYKLLITSITVYYTYCISIFSFFFFFFLACEKTNKIYSNSGQCKSDRRDKENATRRIIYNSRWFT